MDPITIVTKHGTFVAHDARTPDDERTIATIEAVDTDDRTFTIHGKQYRGWLKLERSPYDPDVVYISSYISDLTDSARRKLADALGIVATVLPPLTREESIARMIAHVENMTSSLLTYDIPRLITKEADGARMGGGRYNENALTPVERVRLEQAQLDVVRAWLLRQDQS